MLTNQTVYVYFVKLWQIGCCRAPHTRLCHLRSAASVLKSSAEKLSSKIYSSGCFTSARNGKALLLLARKVGAALCDKGVQAVRQGTDKGIRLRPI